MKDGNSTTLDDVRGNRFSFQLGGEAGESGDEPTGAAARKYEVNIIRIGKDWRINRLAPVPER